MSEIKHFNPSNYQGLAIKNFKVNPLTTTQRNTYGGTLGLTDEGNTVYDKDLDKLFLWNGTAWINADTDEEIVLVANDPLVTTPTILTAGSKIIYSSLTGFFYSVTNPTTTPVITKIGDNVLNITSAISFDATKTDTIQFNNEGKVWLVDDDGTGLLINDGVEEIYAEWTGVALQVGDNTFDITNNSATVTNYRAGLVVPTKSLLKNSVSVDVENEEVIITKKAVSQTQFIVNSDIATTATITLQTLAK